MIKSKKSLEANNIQHDVCISCGECICRDCNSTGCCICDIPYEGQED